MLEYLEDKILGVVLLLQGKIKSQGIVLCAQSLQVKDSSKIQNPQEGNMGLQYSCKW